MNKLEKSYIDLNSLVIFRKILENEVVIKLMELLASTSETPYMQVGKYSSFVSSLLKENIDLSKYFLYLLLEDENIYIFKYINKINIDPVIEECLKNELKILEKISSITSAEIIENISYDGFLPYWNTTDINFSSEYFKRIENISKYGYGVYAKYYAFISDGGNTLPVINPDKTRLSDLKGYAVERKVVIDNTIALLNGRTAANVLLYGDAGTGKSSTVKAIVNEYKDQGLRLVEVSKNQLKDISMLMDKLSKNPLKFIIFIDDLSYTKNDDNFGILKAILEGSISSKPQNIVIYATSNRRHLVKESFDDRDGDDIHLNETVQELTSLSDRFGLHVSFFRPNKKQYLDIVNKLARQYDVKLSSTELELEAERFAVRRSGRSPRIAKQFIQHLKSSE